MREANVTAVEPTPAAQKTWNEDLQRRLARTVWNTGGCSSWYLDAHGKNTTLWPRTTFKLRQLLSRFDTEHYLSTARAPSVVPATAEQSA
jgi:hypothetical protein